MTLCHQQGSLLTEKEHSELNPVCMEGWENQRYVMGIQSNDDSPKE